MTEEEKIFMVTLCGVGLMEFDVNLATLRDCRGDQA
jgi:hypothetical protein